MRNASEQTIQGIVIALALIGTGILIIEILNRI